MKLRHAIVIGGLAAALGGGPLRADVTNTKHNLSVSGPGRYRASEESEVCKFCHTTHTARRVAPLWNRRDSGRIYIKYWSPTLDAYGPGGAPRIEGSSRLCLSCHDGTIALGEVLRGGRIPMRPGTEYLTENARGYVADLSGSHPISFRVTEDLIARNNEKDLPLQPLTVMKSDSTVKLDKFDRIQCTTCHDPHSDKNRLSSGVPFYRKATWDGVCLVCHQDF